MRRWRAACVAVVLLAACGDDDGDGDAAPGTGAPAEGAPAGGAPSTTGSPGSDAAPASATVTAGAPTSTGGATDPPPTAPGWPAVEPGGVGDHAPALLRPDLTERIVVEVHADVEPRENTVAHVVAMLEDVAGKDVAVARAAPPGGGGARDWTRGELVGAADAAATTRQGGGVAVVRLLFVHGTFEGDPGVLGAAVRGDVAAVFVDRVAAAAGLLGRSDGIEVAVAAHEVGHLLGLVDLHLDTGRADPEHPGHSRNPDSVMYWAVESDLVGQLLGADPPRDLDADDRADLATIRGGG